MSLILFAITLSTDSTHRAEKSTPGPPQRSEVTIMRPGGMSRPVGMIHGFRVVPISDVDDHACRFGSLRLPQCSRKPLSHKQRDWPSLLVKRTKVLYPRFGDHSSDRREFVPAILPRKDSGTVLVRNAFRKVAGSTQVRGAGCD